MGTDDAGKGCGQLQLIVDAIIGPYPFDQSASSSPSCTDDGQWNFDGMELNDDDHQATTIKQDAEDPWAGKKPRRVK